MGLTIHYTIAARAEWTPEIIQEKLEAARQFATTLPVLEVSELANFTGNDCDCQQVRGTDREDDDFHWAKIQAQRSITNPCVPGSWGSQSPDSMMVFRVHPAEGSEEANFGICTYPEHIWKADSDSISAWSLAFEKGNHYPECRKVMREFMRRWKLKKLPRGSKRSWSRDRFGGSTGLG